MFPCNDDGRFFLLYCVYVGFAQDGDKYPDWPSDLDEQPLESPWWEAAVDSARSFGNDYFKVCILGI